MAEKLKTGVGAGEGIWGTAVEYAVYQEFGTRAHTIRATNKKALSDGTTLFGKSVKHPGNKAQPFISPSAAIVKAKAAGTFKKEMAVEITNAIANKYDQKIAEGVFFRSADISEAIDLGTYRSIQELLVAAVSQAKDLAPVAEVAGGNLRNSIMWKMKNKDGGYGA